MQIGTKNKIKIKMGPYEETTLDWIRHVRSKVEKDKSLLPVTKTNNNKI